MVFSGPLDSPHGLPIVVALKQQAYGGVHVHMSGFQWVSHEKKATTTTTIAGTDSGEREQKDENKLPFVT